ncbi:MAG: acyl-CoA dehydrogenase family protein [Chromatiales bacterium]|jgi:citronellyl-CoA dehydrogenase|nr:acyl-CoA dehydrogenase family protein [Chromatiales bacterium]MDH3893532.1 acyl-CoA dehydrogenase family protein [Chromatiales bacterium]MDH4012687.1 acyl-CoA dehydrogenase family protein [Chromatiales bacterium]
MQLTEEHIELRRSLEKFIDHEINPHVDDWEREGRFPAHELFRKMGDLGFLGINKPEAYGGLGLDYSYAAVYCETLGRISCGGVPMAIGVQTEMATPALARFGSDELREEFLAPSIAGEKVACLGVSEVGAGSDVASITTTAVKDGDDYVINGGKMWTTSGAQADWMCLLANTGDGAPHRNKSLLCLPMKTRGVTVARTLDKLGMRSSDTAQIHFENVRIPQRFRIGEEGMGFTYQMAQFQEERMYAALSSLIFMQDSIDETIAYTRERRIFGKPVLDHQAVHFRLAELQTELESLRALTWDAVERYCGGEDMTKLASMAKLKSGRLSRELNDACLQYWGGMGFMEENPIVRRFRDGRLASIGGGADEVMLSIISKYMGTLPGRSV